MFQRPKRASVISTHMAALNKDTQTARFNALNGLLSFLRSNYFSSYIYSGMFQRPKRASVISTEKGADINITGITVFQRPKRASVISTRLMSFWK